MAGRDDLIEAYLAALERELAWLGEPREVDTLFFGGGTPTHLPPEQLERLLRLAQRWFPPASGAEVCVEANPADLDLPRCDVLAAHGITRVSLGVQSFQPEKLELLERDHRRQQVEQAVARVRAFAPSLSLDLIFGTPGETLATWTEDLESALALLPQHLSTYGLTFERGTLFWNRLARGELGRCDEDLEGQMYELAIDRLTAAGFEHYEVSNFAQPGHRSRHNEAYWTGRGYFAAGPGAARYLNGRREMNHRSTTTYIARLAAGQSPVADAEELPPEDAARERLVFALRRLEGIDLEAFAAETGFRAETLGGQALLNYLEMGFLERSVRRLRLTRRGLLLSDSLWPAFLQGEADS